MVNSDIKPEKTMCNSDKINNGVYYTKIEFAELSHKYLESEYGLNWQNELVIWDCSCGIGNLTRSLVSDNIFLSSKDSREIKSIRDCKFDEKFKFDFLNDDDKKLPGKLLEDLNSGVPILFLINPPYARAASLVSGERVSSGNGISMISEDMKNLDMGSCSQQLYVQFLFRIMAYQWVNKNIHIAVFSPNSFLIGSSYAEFRKRWLNTFEFKRGFMFKASCFTGVKDDWSICFSIWSPAKKVSNILQKKKPQSEFKFDLIEYNRNKTKLKLRGSKVIYNLDNKHSATEWLKEDSTNQKSFDVPNLSNPFNVKEDGEGKMVNNALGYFLCSGNNINKNSEAVAIFSSAFSGRRGISILRTNFYKCSIFFTCRQLVKANWMNWQDEYYYPNINHPEFEQFKYDSVVYSLFSTKSYQSSLRNIKYKGERYDIKNEFFWMPKNKIQSLAEEYDYQEIIDDLKNSNERFLYGLLYKNNISEYLSEDVKELLDIGTNLVEISFPYRKEFALKHPEYHLNSWDAGFVQIKKILNSELNLKNSLIEWKRCFDSVSERLLSQVYNLSFLRK